MVWLITRSDYPFSVWVDLIFVAPWYSYRDQGVVRLKEANKPLREKNKNKTNKKKKNLAVSILNVNGRGAISAVSTSAACRRLWRRGTSIWYTRLWMASESKKQTQTQTLTVQRIAWYPDQHSHNTNSSLSVFDFLKGRLCFVRAEREIGRHNHGHAVESHLVVFFVVHHSAQETDENLKTYTIVVASGKHLLFTAACRRG